MGRLRGQVRPDVSNQYGLAVNRILSKKLSAPIFEFAHLRWIQLAGLAVGPIEPPLVRLRIIRPQSQPFDVARRAIEFDRVQLRSAVPNLEAGSRTLRFHPRIRACQGMRYALDVKFPLTNQGIKIVLAV